MSQKRKASSFIISMPDKKTKTDESPPNTPSPSSSPPTPDPQMQISFDFSQPETCNGITTIPIQYGQERKLVHFLEFGQKCGWSCYFRKAVDGVVSFEIPDDSILTCLRKLDSMFRQSVNNYYPPNAYQPFMGLSLLKNVNFDRKSVKLFLAKKQSKDEIDETSKKRIPKSETDMEPFLGLPVIAKLAFRHLIIGTDSHVRVSIDVVELTFATTFTLEELKAQPQIQAVIPAPTPIPSSSSSSPHPFILGESMLTQVKYDGSPDGKRVRFQFTYTTKGQTYTTPKLLITGSAYVHDVQQPDNPSGNNMRKTVVLEWMDDHMFAIHDKMNETSPTPLKFVRDNNTSWCTLFEENANIILLTGKKATPISYPFERLQIDMCRDFIVNFTLVITGAYNDQHHPTWLVQPIIERMVISSSRKGDPKIGKQVKRVSFDQNTRNEIAKRQDFKCVHCSQSLGHDFEVDHIVPISNGGTNNTNNLQGICVRDHKKKSKVEASMRARRKYCSGGPTCKLHHKYDPTFTTVSSSTLTPLEQENNCTQWELVDSVSTMKNQSQSRPLLYDP